MQIIQSIGLKPDNPRERSILIKQKRGALTSRWIGAAIKTRLDRLDLLVTCPSDSSK